MSPKKKYEKINYTQNSIELRYSFPLYTTEPVYYQAFLQGLDQGWSEKSGLSVFKYDRLPPGMYELHVKAIDSWNNESQPHILTFEILPPLYQTTVAKISYFILLILGLLIFRAWGIRQTRKKERLQLEKREQELIRLRNEKLRTKIEHKSKELANSTMSIIKKNEFCWK